MAALVTATSPDSFNILPSGFKRPFFMAVCIREY